jgi:acetylornithine deacetylase
MDAHTLYIDALQLLQQLISTQSFSREEDKTAELIVYYLQSNRVETFRHLNNVWAVNKHFDAAKPTLLLNSHHDTVKPNPQYTKDPFDPIIEDDILYGLGSNDAGGCLVSLLATFVYFYDKDDLPINVVVAATAEEEISGFNGIEALLQLDEFNTKTAGAFKSKNCFGIVGEPTKMNLAIAEKGLMVLDCVAHGRAGHAAREEGDNAIYHALKDIEWFNNYQFEKISEWLGPVKLSVTVIETENKAHNVVPAICKFVVDIRVTDLYSHEDVLDIVRLHVKSEIKPRSLRMRSTAIDVKHPLIVSALKMGKECYGSPTCSDKALMPFPALKCGPGDSARSHTADEYIYLHEIENGIKDYIQMIEGLKL